MLELLAQAVPETTGGGGGAMPMASLKIAKALHNGAELSGSGKAFLASMPTVKRRRRFRATSGRAVHAPPTPPYRQGPTRPDYSKLKL